jgi:4-diphosphocytidyl-2C-methyl-D-erythritol kinase
MTEAARQVNPEMSLLMLQIERLTRRKVFMSGSGSTVFIVARSCSEAAAFQSQISKTLHRVVWILETA